MQLIDNIDTDSIIAATDSYKWTHHNMYPENTRGVYSYMESRKGAHWDHTNFFGLQYQLKRYLAGRQVTWERLEQARAVAEVHLRDNHIFNYAGWAHIIEKHQGRLPLRIKAVPEGTAVPTGNVMMTVENTDPACWWLTNAVESLLTHVWHTSNVCTLSNVAKGMFRDYLTETAMDLSALDYMLQDFGYRGAPGHEAGGIGGAAHLVNFLGTDTIPGLLFAMKYYNANLEGLGYSVPATEHSIMSALGREGEMNQVQRVFDQCPTGIVSIVGDTYDFYRFVKALGSQFKDQIMGRDGKAVSRPDSKTPDHDTSIKLTLWMLDRFWHDFGGTVNAKGYKVLDPHIGGLWGDGLVIPEMGDIMEGMMLHSFSVENMVFGMGGGLHQKHDRDTQRIAFKASQIDIDGKWHDISKEPLDSSKRSKAGRLALRCDDGENWRTVPEADTVPEANILRTVFENGRLYNELSFDEVRANAGNKELVAV